MTQTYTLSVKTVQYLW